MGRTFSPDEEGEHETATLVLSFGLWQSRFGSDPDIVGQSITLNDRLHVIVGVMPAGFNYPSGAELWVHSYQYGVPEPPFSLGADLAEVRGLGYFNVIGRLADGITLQQADAEMGAIASRL